MPTIEELTNQYAESGVAQGETRRLHIHSFTNWLYSNGYECHVRLTRAAAEQQRAALTAQRDALDERIAELDKELQQ